MDGIKDFFEAFAPTNFWDIRNTCVKDFTGWNRYREEDWRFYQQLRAGRITTTNRHEFHCGDRYKYFNVNEDGSGGADGLYILAPTEELAAQAVMTGDYNDGSYVILYKSVGGRILLCGDIHDKTMEHLLRNCRSDVEDIDLLIAPHHGRHSDRSYDFLNIMRPKMTFFGNAPSEYLAYSAWSSRGLPYITNNQADCMIVDTDEPGMALYVTNDRYARRENRYTFQSRVHGGWFVKHINLHRAAA